MSGSRAKRLRKENPKIKAVKVPTPPEQRSYVTEPVLGPGGTKFERFSKSRSEKKVSRFLERFTPSQASAE